MKKEFTKEYMINNCGCYSQPHLMICSFMKLDIININDILNSEIPLKDKAWFVIKKTELTLEQKKLLALLLAKSVVGIYNKKYPNDNRVNDCISAIELFNEGKISIDELREKRKNAADAAYAAADAAYAAAYAVYAAADAVYAAAYAADAAYAVAYAADAADAAADAADAADAAYKEIVLNVLIEFCKNNGQKR